MAGFPPRRIAAAAAAALCLAATRPGRAAPAAFSGVVRDASGVPLGGLEISLHGSYEPMSPPCRKALSGADGSFSVAMPGPGECPGDGLFYKVADHYGEQRHGPLNPESHIPPPNWKHLLGYYLDPVGPAEAARELVVADRYPDWNSCRWRLDAAAEGPITVSGRAVDAAGEAIRHATVEFVTDEAAPRRIGHVETAADGSYRAFLPGDACRGNLLRYPGRALARLLPPAGSWFPEPPAPARLSLASAGAALRADFTAAARPAAGRVCGEVELLGRPLPEGFVSLMPAAGTPERRNHTLVPVRDGRFCAPAVAPGDYGLLLSPRTTRPPHEPQLPRIDAVARGAGSGPAAIRVDAGGSFRVLGASGPVRVPLALEYRAAPASGALAPVAGRLRFPRDAAPGTRALLLAQTLDDRADRYSPYRFAWVDHGPGGGDFELAVDSGTLYRFAVKAPGLAVHSLRFAAATPASPTSPRILAVLGPAARIRGRVLLPDGRPFRPFYHGDQAKSSLLVVKLVDFWGDRLDSDGALVDQDGRYELDGVAPGLYHLHLQWVGVGFDWSLPPVATAWARAGFEAEVDFRLQPWSQVAAARGPGDPKPYWGPEHFSERLFRNPSPRERWLVALPAGALAPDGASTLLLPVEAPISFIQDSAGLWQPHLFFNEPDPMNPQLPAGDFAVYSLERVDPFSRPALRVRSVAARSLRAGRVERLAYREEPARASAGAALAGTLRSRRRPGLEELRAAGTFAELHRRLVPRLEVYDGSGALLAAAFVPMGYDEFGEAGRAAARGEGERLAALAELRDREFLLDELPAGEFRVVARAFGYPDRTLRVRLRPGRTARVEIDFDR